MRRFLGAVAAIIVFAGQAGAQVASTGVAHGRDFPGSWYVGFANGIPPAASFFPITVWLQNPIGADNSSYANDAAAAKAEGIDIWDGIWLWPEGTASDSGELAALKAQGLYLLAQGVPGANNFAYNPDATVGNVLALAAAESAQSTVIGWLAGDEPGCDSQQLPSIGPIAAADATRPVFENAYEFFPYLTTGAHKTCLATTFANYMLPGVTSVDYYPELDGYHQDVTACGGGQYVAHSDFLTTAQDCTWGYGLTAADAVLFSRQGYIGAPAASFRIPELSRGGGGFVQWDTTYSGTGVAVLPQSAAQSDGQANVGFWGGVLGDRSEISSGKYYAEFSTTRISAGGGVGLATPLAALNNPTTAATALLLGSGAIEVNGATVATLSPGFNAGQTAAMAVDLGAGKAWFTACAPCRPEVWDGNPADNPATGAGGFSLAALTSAAGAEILPYALLYQNGDNAALDAGATPFQGPVPSGFGPWTIAANPSGKPAWVFVDAGGDANGESAGNPYFYVSTTAGSTAITLQPAVPAIPGQQFTAAWTGLGVAGAGIPTSDTIASVTSGTVAQLATAATATASYVQATLSGARCPVAATDLCLPDGNEYRPAASQVNAAAWLALISGANGIRWFCHDLTSAAFCLGADAGGAAAKAVFTNVQYIDATIASFAAELNSPSLGACSMQNADLSVSASCAGGILGLSTDTAAVPGLAMAKPGPGGALSLFAASGRHSAAGANFTFTLAGWGGRTATIEYDSDSQYDPAHASAGAQFTLDGAGRFSDSFGAHGDDYQVKVYAIR